VLLASLSSITSRTPPELAGNDPAANLTNIEILAKTPGVKPAIAFISGRKSSANASVTPECVPVILKRMYVTLYSVKTPTISLESPAAEDKLLFVGSVPGEPATVPKNLGLRIPFVL
jgi:hypothetical protein